MRVLKRYKNSLKLRIEVTDDLWHLLHVLKAGDELSGITSRLIKRVEDEGERKSVFIKIKVDKISFQAFSGDMRVLGTILEGPEDVALGSFHTFTLKPGSEIEITKEWKRWELDRLNEAQQNQPMVGLVVMDNEQALVGATHTYGIKTLAKLESHTPKKGEAGYESAMRTYFGEIAIVLAGLEVEKILVGGPGFAKDNFNSFLEEKYPAVAKKISITSTSTATESGFRELVSNVIDQVLKQSRLKKENTMVEELVTQIGKGGAVEYGLEHVKNAVEYGAVEVLLVSEKNLMEGRLNMNSRLDDLMEDVRQKSGEVIVVSEHTEAGKKLIGLGGIAAHLRFKIH